MGIKEFYYGLEDKWYALLDKIDAKLPIYKVIEPIDKVIPSFLLFLILILAAVLFLAMPLFGIFGAQEYSISFLVTDSGTSKPVENAAITLSYGDKTEIIYTDIEGKTDALKLPKDTVADYSIKYSGYKTKSGSQLMDSDYLELAVLLQAEGPIEFAGEGEEINFTIQTPDGEKITEAVKVEFDCTTPEAEDPSTQTVYNGEVFVVKPKNCGDLKYKVSSEKYESSGYWEPAVNGGIAIMQEKIESFGSVTVNLMFNNKTTDETVWVEIYKTDDDFSEGEGEYVDSKYGEGQVIFESVATGTYFVKTKGTDIFASSASSTFTLAEGENKTITIDLKEAILGSIKVHVKSKSFGFNIKDAAITLKKGKATIETHYTDEVGEIEPFKVGEDTAYNLVVSHPDYCIKKVTDIKIKEETYLVELESGIQCKTQLQVKIVDSEGNAVANAHVGLYSPDGYSVGLPQTFTDVNGEGKFTTSEYTTYKVFAYKGSSSGWSDALQFTADNSEELVYTVVLDIPNGILKIMALDEDGKPLQFANVTLRDTFDNTVLGGGSKPIESADGILSLTLKADKSVYAIVEKADYSTYISQPVEIIGNGEAEIKAILMPNIVGGDITWKEKGVTFLGLFKGKDRVLDITNGEKYTAKFKLNVPKDVSYNTLGFHLRTGNEGISNKLETDPAQINSINAPSASKIVKGTAYNPPANQADDMFYKSEGAAKWATVEWYGIPENASITVEFEIEVKKEALFGEAVLLDWRAYAINSEGTLINFPEDKSASAAQGSDLVKELLYAKTNIEKFVVGVEKVCSEKWCFSAYITDESSKLMESATEGYQSKVGTDYTLEFKIINNSESEMDTYYESDLQIKDVTESLDIVSYTISGAQGHVESRVSGSDLDEKIGFDTGKLDAGNIQPNSQVTGKIKFNPKKTGATPFTFYIFSGKKGVLEETLNIVTTADNEFKLEYENDGTFTDAAPLLPSGKSNDIVVRAKNAVTGLEVDKAVISVKDKYGALLSQAQTNALGIAKLKLPAMQPAEKIKLMTEKANYKVFATELTVDSAVISVNPLSLTYNLNPKAEPEKTSNFTITNKTEMELTIKSIELTGTFYDLIDTGAVENYLLTEYKGKKLVSKGYETVNLPVKLSTIGLKTEKPRSVDGKLKVTVSALGKEWIQNIDIKVSIGLGGEADNADCFTVNKAEWIGATEGAPRSLEIKIENNCVTKGIPITLDNLQATAEWKTNHLGIFELKLEEDTIQVSSGFYKLIKPKLEKGEIITGVLTFTPDGGVIGAAEATIKIKAENFVDSGVQDLEKSLNVKMTVTNLADCIMFSQDLIKTKIGTDATLGIETKNCGKEVDFQLKTALDLDSKEFTLQGTDKKDIKIYTSKEQYAGQYPINVFVKGLEKTEFEPRKMIRVRILGGDCYEISKYEMDIYQNPDKDSAVTGYDIIKVRNKCYEGQFEVTRKYDTSCWFNRGDEPWYDVTEWDAGCKGTATLMGAGIGFLVGGLGALGESGCFWGEGGGLGCDDKACKGKADNAPCAGGICKGGKCEAKEAGTDKECAGKENGTTCKDGFKCFNGKCLTGEEYGKVAGAAAGEAAAQGKDFMSAELDCEAQAQALKGCLGTSKYTPSCSGSICVIMYKISEKDDATKVFNDCETKAKKVSCDDKPETKPECTNQKNCKPESKGFSKDCVQPLCNDSKCEYDQYVKGTPCGTNQTCNGEGKCISGNSKKAGEICTTNSDCATSLVCIANNCAAAPLIAPQATLAIPPVTGNYPYGQQGYGGGYGYDQGYGGGMGGIGSGIGGLVNGVGGTVSGLLGIVNMGLTNPWAGMGLGAITGLLAAWATEDSGSITQQLILKEIPFTAEEIGAMKEDYVYNDQNLLLPGHMLLLQTKETEFEESDATADANAEAATGLTAMEQIEPLFEGAGFELINQSILPNPEKPGQFMEEFEYKITNTAGLKQVDQYTPIFTVLSAGGKETRAKYCTTVARSEKANCDGETLTSNRKLTPKDAAVEKGQSYIEKFRIQLNAFEPTKAAPVELEVLPCTIGTMTGKTGKNAMPKLLFTWDFTKVKENACDEKNANNAYCDAVQFSSELLQKIKSLDEKLDAAGNLKCPSALGVATHLTNELSKYDKDVAITDLFISKEAANTIKVKAVLAENGHNTEMWANVEFSYPVLAQTPGTSNTTETEEVTFTSLGSVEKVLSIPEGTHDVSVKITDWGLTVAGEKCTTANCESKCGKACKNGDTTNDELTAEITINSSTDEGLAECEPYSTERLTEYANANAGLEPVIELTSFYSYLMNDGYSEDFKKDFVEYLLASDFFTGVEENYSDLLNKYFLDNERFKFESPMLKAPYNNIDAGKYKVTISIVYDKENPWQLFNTENDPTANITVKLEKLSNPSPDSPFYYMPVDGIVGKNSEDGRQGYGVNYFQAETIAPEKTILINELDATDKYAVIAQDIPGSNAVTKVNVARYDDFQLMNNVFRGIILAVDRSNVNEPSIKFYPSLAAPAVLKVNGGDMEKAYAYYSLMLDEQPQEPGDHLAMWSAFGLHCKDFEGVELIERWPVGGAPDFKGMVQRANACSKGTAPSDYGFEWCNMKKKGNVYLGTVFFIPQDSKDKALLKMRTMHNTDGAQFVYPDGQGTGQMSLKPVEFENAYIRSVEQVIKQIEGGNICVAGYNNPSKVNFFWNPQKILTEKYSNLLTEVNSSEDPIVGCITE